MQSATLIASNMKKISNRELASTLTVSLNLSGISAFILNVSLIEILVCVSWKPNFICCICMNFRYVVLLKRREMEYCLF